MLKKYLSLRKLRAKQRLEAILTPVETLRIDVERFEANIIELLRFCKKLDNSNKFTRFISSTGLEVCVQDNTNLIKLPSDLE